MFTVSCQALGLAEISTLRELQKSCGEGPKQAALILKVTLRVVRPCGLHRSLSS